MSVLRSCVFYIAFYGASVFWVLGAVAASYVAPRRMRWFCDMWSGWHTWCVRHILGIEVRITGQRLETQAFYAIKHESFFEAISMPWLFDFPSTFAKQELSDIVGFGHASRTYGNISVARDQGASALRQMLKQVRPVLAAGRPIAIFPEGSRVPHGTRPPLQAGFAGLYKLLGLPVVPVAVDSGPLYHRRWKQRGTITIHFGEAIPPGLPREEVEARVRDGINCLNS